MLRSSLVRTKYLLTHVQWPLLPAAAAIQKDISHQMLFSTKAVTCIDYDAKAQHVMAFDTLVDLQRRACDAYADHKFLGTRNGNTFDYITYGEFAKKVETCRHV